MAKPQTAPLKTKLPMAKKVAIKPQAAVGKLSSGAAARIRAKANAVLAGCLLLVLGASLHAQVYNPTTGWFGQTLIPITYANWSALGTGCTSSNVSSIAGGAIKVISSTGAQNVCGMSVAASGTFSHVFVLYGSVNQTATTTVEVGFTDGTKVEYCGPTFSSTSGVISLGKATLLTGGTLTSANGISTFTGPMPNTAGPLFLRLSAAAGTSLACDFSPDGINWVNLFTDTTPFLTPSGLYFAADPRGATSTSMGILASYN